MNFAERFCIFTDSLFEYVEQRRRRRTETEAKAKVVASHVWGGRFVQFLAALTVLPR